jgi:hypothetical protein
MTARVPTPFGGAPTAALAAQGQPVLKADSNGNAVATIQGIPLVTAVPTYTPGPGDSNVVFATADNKIHLYNGTTWVATAALS